MMARLVFDVETDGLDATKIWCIVAQDVDSKEIYAYGPDKLDAGYARLDSADGLVGHNIIGYDIPVIRKLMHKPDFAKDKTIIDTLVLSRLFNPVKDGGHSLNQWGNEIGFNKLEFKEFDTYSEEMLEYCIRDVDVLEATHKRLEKEMQDWGDSIQLEHEVAMHINRQEKNGFKLNAKHTHSLLVQFKMRMVEIEITLQKVFPPIITERFSEKTGKQLKDDVEVFNVGSRQQIAKRLQSLGVKFNKTTEKGQIVINEKILAEINLPEAQMINEYLMLQKRVGLVEAWLESADDTDRVHGRVISNGAVTGRMTHSSPNMGQIPSVSSEYGKECRQCWTVEEGNVLVGTDLSGIELRCLAHYMQDDNYTKEILDGDIHQTNADSAGVDRPTAKTMIYALLYGCGINKLASILNTNVAQAQTTLDKFYKNTPKLKKLILKVQRIASKGYVPGLDGRRIRIRSEHAALNSLLQSCGAIIAKKWCVEAHKMLRRANIPVKQVAFVHDEIQVEVPQKYGQQTADIMTKASERAGRKLGFRLPVESEAKIGRTWFDTH